VCPIVGLSCMETVVSPLRVWPAAVVLGTHYIHNILYVLWVYSRI
jgi:hypothetical protein